jgi:mono/diheme cytochrome c family protein
MRRTNLVVLVAALAVAAPQLPAQSPQSADRELAGKKLFLQRCSICHLPPLNEPANPDPQPYGPKLNGFVKDAATENRARQAILNGTPRMPGFQYGLTRDEIENIIVYLKTFK